MSGKVFRFDSVLPLRFLDATVDNSESLAIIYKEIPGRYLLLARGTRASSSLADDVLFSSYDIATDRIAPLDLHCV